MYTGITIFTGIEWVGVEKRAGCKHGRAKNHAIETEQTGKNARVIKTKLKKKKPRPKVKVLVP